MAITSANQLELLQTAEAVAREKMIDPGLVVEAMEESLARAAKSRYGAEMDIRVHIDRKTGRATFTRVRTVVADDELENYQAEFTVEQAKQYMDNPEIGQQLIEEVPPVEMGRIAAQSAKQVILQRSAKLSATASTKNSRIARVRSSMVWSSVKNMATLLSMWALAKRSCAATRKLAAKAIAPMIVSAFTSRTCVASSVDRRFS